MSRKRAIIYAKFCYFDEAFRVKILDTPELYQKNPNKEKDDRPLTVSFNSCLGAVGLATLGCVLDVGWRDGRLG